jgi:mannose/fructose/N-acetylgalactosamine-specific phosphotransferase system component IIC
MHSDKIYLWGATLSIVLGQLKTGIITGAHPEILD